MITAYIFSGPTLPHFKIAEHLGHEVDENNQLLLPSGHRIQFMPPVAEGDLLPLISHRPQIIGIIDGYFETVPAVWHKEILYTMSQGIHVLGASSMGALRAAELAPYGMEGIGAVYQAFADGLLEDDDEVTVVHGAAELGFPALSEAMVNIRRTLTDARAQNILTTNDHDTLLSIGKALHYKSRSYGRIISLAQTEAVPATTLEKFQAWLPEGRKDQKLIDALALLKTLITKLNNGVEPKQVSYAFSSTIPWQKSRSKVAC